MAIRKRLAVLASAAILLLLAGCGPELYGSAADYQENFVPVAPLQMSPDALHIASQFAPRNGNDFPGHYGFDIWGPLGTPIIAAAPGRVVESYYDARYGNRILIDHGRDSDGQNVFTEYKHMKTRVRDVGDVVARGEQVGTMGATGFLGLAIHLHFEVQRGPRRQQAKPEDPHGFWLDGPGRVTCLDRTREIPALPIRTTYPVPCRSR